MKRLENGLIEGVNYIRDESTGKINWLKMIPEEYLYINEFKKEALEKRLGKTFGEIQISEVKDTEKIITLQGIRYLLDLRGYKECDIKVDACSQDYASATCRIKFIANEEENFEQIYTGNASAHAGNTKDFYKNYLVEAASNRALCRAVRFFLKINIVSKDELSDSENFEDEIETSSNLLPYDMLNKKLKEMNKDLNWINKEFKSEWDEIKNIPKAKVFEIMGKLKTL